MDQMTSTTVRKTGLAVAAASALIGIGVPLAMAAPTAAPPSDGEGYVNSTARCTAPDTAVVFGSTQSSRVAICKTSGGSFEYRGVRISDGAKLIAPATQTSGNTFVVDNDGVKYTITPTALSVTANGDTFRTETWSDYHGPKTSSSTEPSTSSAPTTSGTAKPSTSGSSTATSPATKASASPTSAAPLPPPMAAEVGGGSSSGE